MQTVKRAEGIAAAYSDPATIILDDFVTLVGVLPGATADAPKKFGQLRLIVLGCTDGVGSTVANGLRNGRLRAHGIYGDDAAAERHGRQQFRDRGLLVRVLGRRALTEHQTGLGRERTYRVQGVESVLSARRLVLPLMTTASPFAGTSSI